MIGGLLLADEIPNLCRRVYTYIQQRQMKYSEYNRETPFMVISVVKIILAGLILAEHRRIVSLIVRNTNPETESVIDE